MILIDFISAEIGTRDLTIGFAIADTSGSENIVLVRTPEFEPLLDEYERGVHVSDDTSIDSEILESIFVSGRIMKIRSSTKTYELDLRSVDDDEFVNVISVLNKMNFDESFSMVTK